MFSRIKQLISSQFHPSQDMTLFVAIKPLYVLLSILGLFPYSIRFDTSRKRFEIFHRSLYTNSMYTISFALVLLSSFVVHVQSILTSGKSYSFSDVALTQLNYIVEQLILLFVCIVSYICSHVNKSRYVQILNSVLHAGSKMSACESKLSYTPIYLRVRYQVILGLFVMLFVNVAVQFTRNEGWWKVAMVMMSFVLPQMIQFCVLFHFYVMLLLVISILRSLHDTLQAYIPEKSTIRREAEKLPLPVMKIVYNDAFEITKDINESFAAPILVTVIGCFHAIVSESYILYYGVARGTMTSHEVVNCTTWVLWQCFKIFLISNVGNLVKMEAVKIEQKLHNIPVEKATLRTLSEIQNFSIQMYYQKTELSVYGYFPLDSTLLYNMVGAAAMYFIILVQLDRQYNMFRGRFLATLPMKRTRWMRGGGMMCSSTKPTGMKVTICGAAGATGQPLALMLKQSPLVDELALYDLVSTCGYGMELGHVDTKCNVTSYSGACALCASLKDAKVVVIVAGSGAGDSFENSAPIVSGIATQICYACPKAITIVATEPVESMVPLVAEIQRLCGCYDPRRLLGATEHQSMRANILVAKMLNVVPESIRVPIIGGCSANTMVPVLSRAVFPVLVTQEQIESVTTAILGNSGRASPCPKSCSEGACLSGACAVARVVLNVVRGLVGESVKQCAYVDTQHCCIPECQFLCNDVILGPTGVEKSFGIPDLSAYEDCLFRNAIPLIRKEISRAEWMVYCMSQEPCSSAAASHICCGPHSCCYCRHQHTCNAARGNQSTGEGFETCHTCCYSLPQWRPKEPTYQLTGCENQKHRLPRWGRHCGYQRPPRTILLIEQKNSGNC